MIIVNSSFNAESIKKLNNFTIKQKLFIYILFGLLFAVLGIIGIIIKIDLAFSIILIIMGILYVPILLLLVHFNTRSSIKTMKVLQANIIERWIFDENAIAVESYKDGELTGRSFAKYGDYYKAWIDNDTLFLYLNKQQANIINLTSFEEGTKEELEALLVKQFDENSFHIK